MKNEHEQLKAPNNSPEEKPLMRSTTTIVGVEADAGHPSIRFFLKRQEVTVSPPAEHHEQQEPPKVVGNGK